VSAPLASRREVLGATAALLGLAVAPRAVAATDEGAAFILDARLPEAAALAARARMAGHRAADPQGEMVRLLFGPQGKALTGSGTIIGLSTYSDFVLARDVLRDMGRAPREALALPLADHDAPPRLLALLHNACQRQCASQATSYLWLA
jgi:hypothetical protein